MAAPYIMPDGRSLRDYLRTEREREERRKLRHAQRELRGKDETFLLLQSAKAKASEHEIAELRRVEAAGARRRRRFLNDKVLRSEVWVGMAGEGTAKRWWCVVCP